MRLAHPLEPLGAYPQFVAWRLEWNAEREKWDKIPYSPIHGGKAASTRPTDWGTYEQAEEFRAAAGMDGVGFVFTERDPFWFLDIDGALVDGKWSMVAQELCARLAGACVEVSQSGTGLHIIGSGAASVAALNHRNKNIPLHLELYTKERFVALTGLQATGNAGADLSHALPAIAEQFFKRDAGQTADEWTTEPDAEWSGPEDDGELIARALRSGQQSAASAFGASGSNPTFADLWEARPEVLGAKWPSNSPGDPYDRSSADQSMANLLAFWTGRNCDRIERIMRMSALARPKWEPEVHATYLQNTILKAIGLVRTVYKQPDRQPATPAPPPSDEEVEDAGFTVRGGSGLMLYQQQLEYFAGCAYIRSLNKILTPGGDLLDQARFCVEYGGHEFVIALDGKKSTTSAWTAFTENQAFQPVIADRICFRPERGPGGIIKDSGKLLANTYQPAETEEVEGDPSPFINHMRKMLPHGEDFEILISYMASVKQNPGMKAQWWPVVQGAEGNFKSFLLLIMAHAVGTHYSHMPNMEKMVRNGSNFNGWIDRKLFLGLDEVYASNRREFFEGFKTTVTNRSIPVEGKGVEEVTSDNRANGMIVTNHQDGVPISGKHRRFAAFFCAQQTPEDMARDGMDAAYIANLKDWLLGSGPYEHLGVNYGVRVMNYHLARRPIEARLDPARLCIRCPETTSTAQAIRAGRGQAEQIVQEAIEEGRPGFAGGWVSSIFLDRLLELKHIKIPYSKRRELLQTLGYDYHPALPEGRVHNSVSPDAGKPRLYVKTGHIALNYESGAAVAKAYSEAQLAAGSETSAAGMAFSK